MACANAEAKFICAMRSLMYKPLLSRVKHWHKAKKVKFYDDRKCEIGSCIYQPKGARETLRVVFIRALKAGEQKNSLFGDSRYDYRAFVTNLGEHEMKNEAVVLYYRSRSDVENFIREAKNGFDLKHFPCLKLDANRAYGLIAAFAQNLVRYMAYIENPRKPHFAKVLRFKVVMLPVLVVKHARSIRFRFMTHHKKEVLRWQYLINKQFGFAIQCMAPPPAL